MPKNVPPQLKVYQFKVVPEPADALRLTYPPSFEHMLFLSTATDKGANGEARTVIYLLTQAELPHADSHLAQYVMDDVGEVNTLGFPDPTIVPPQLVLYQTRLVPYPPETLREIVPPPFEQKLFLSVIAVDGGAVACETFK